METLQTLSYISNPVNGKSKENGESTARLVKSSKNFQLENFTF